MKKLWSRIYRRHTKIILHIFGNDENIKNKNSLVNQYNVTDWVYRCNGNIENCSCSNQGYKYCKLKNK